MYMWKIGSKNIDTLTHCLDRSFLSCLLNLKVVIWEHLDAQILVLLTLFEFKAPPTTKDGFDNITDSLNKVFLNNYTLSWREFYLNRNSMIWVNISMPDSQQK